ncbi:MAG: hypothetical protein EAZ57_08050 [Cytophagales bacterium]|nr:MAG: hypothetical protein EAZ67_09130 [Cytophagales bacterium]TAF60285.1 MAG: hypothetical protein EAZ57_08050 [Cytophagales bacterium]
MKPIFKLPLVYLVLLLCTFLGTRSLSAAKAGYTLSKKINMAFRANPNIDVHIVNKYGKVQFVSWDKDSVRMVVEMTALGKDEDVAEDILKSVDVDYTYASNYLTAVSIYDKSEGVVMEFFNKMLDQAKAIINKQTLQVDYILYVPQQAQIDVENKYGDVILDDHKARTSIELSHGNLRAGNLSGDANIRVEFGKSYMTNMKNGRFVLRFGDLDVQQAEDISLESISSEIRIDKVNRLVLSSKSDKIDVQEAKILDGKTVFTKLSIGSLSQSSKCITTGGNFTVRKINQSFQTLDLTAQSTDIRIDVDDASAYKIDVNGKEQNMVLPLISGMQKSYLDPKNKNVMIQGFMGSGNQTSKETNKILRVNSQGGSVIIR